MVTKLTDRAVGKLVQKNRWFEGSRSIEDYGFVPAGKAPATKDGLMLMEGTDGSKKDRADG